MQLTIIRPETGILLKDIMAKTFNEIILQAEIHFRAGYYAKAAKEYSRAVQLMPDDATSHYNLGVSLANDQQYKSALKSFSKALALNELYSDAYFNRGITYFNLGEYDEAVKDLSFLIDFLQEDIEASVYEMRGRSYLALGNHVAAQRDFKKVVKLDRLSASGWMNLGKTYSEMGKFQLAVKNFTRAIKLTADNSRLSKVYYNRSIAFESLGQYDKAIRDITKAMQIDGAEAQLRHLQRRARLENKQGRIEEALADLHTAIASFPNDTNVGLDFAATLIQQGEFDKAIKEYDRLLENGHESHTVYFNRGTVYGMLEKYESALQDLDSAVKLAPHHAESRISRGAVLSRLNKWQEAWDDFNYALEIHPEMPEALLNRGIAYLELDQPKDAVNDLEESIKLLSHHQEVAYLKLAVAYSRLGNLDQAAKSLRKSVALDNTIKEKIHEDPELRTIVNTEAYQNSDK